MGWYTNKNIKTHKVVLTFLIYLEEVVDPYFKGYLAKVKTVKFSAVLSISFQAAVYLSIFFSIYFSD